MRREQSRLAMRPAGETFRWRDTLRNRGPAELLVEW